MTTFVLVGSLLAVLVLSAILGGVLMQLGLRWAKVPGGTLLRSTLLAIVASLISSGLVALLGLVLNRTPNWVWIEAAAGFGFGCAVTVALILRVYKTTISQAVKAWLPTLLQGFVVLPFMVIVYKPYLYEGFLIPANSMSPTLIGDHVVGRCPECGAPAYGAAPQHREQRGGRSTESVRMICTNFHSSQSTEHDAGGHTPDRIAAAKFLMPRRWELAVFRVPGEPEQNYVKRVVGLPGETVTIRDGAVFINGTKLDPPAELQGIRYVTKFPDFPQGDDCWGSPEKPAVLGADEYFVLGDHTTASLDSRLWEQGAAGHPPYAVPKSFILGVATHIYWPPERMRTLR